MTTEQYLSAVEQNDAAMRNAIMKELSDIPVAQMTERLEQIKEESRMWLEHLDFIHFRKSCQKVDHPCTECGGEDGPICGSQFCN